MTDLLIINEDTRRRLVSFAEGKTLYIKEDCIVGNHYHKTKTEIFVLSKGECELTIKGEYCVKMKIGKIYQVDPYEHHSFNIKKGSILIGLCSHPYDPKDDYKI